MKLNKFVKTNSYLIGASFAVLILSFFSTYYFFNMFTFDFVDEFFNILAGYFMNQDMAMYSDFFYNRNPFMGYVSYGVQKILKPAFLYQQIMYHRLFVLLFSFIWGVLLIARFRWLGIGFVLLYEYIKYYLFGFLFQGEAIIVYPLVYTAGILFLRLQKQEVSLWEYFLVSLLLWFSFWTREVYAPLCLFLYLCLLISMRNKHWQISSLGLFCVFMIITLVALPLRDYWFQVFSVNSQTVAKSDIAMYGGPAGTLLRSAGYPFYVFFSGQNGHLQTILSLLSALFLILVFHLLKQKNVLLVALTFVILAIAAIRPHTPGMEFYGAYRMIVWYGLFIFSILAYVSLIKKKRYVLLLVGVILLSYFLPQSYIWKGIPSRADQFFISYNHYNEPGEVIRALKNDNDTLFVDGYQALVFISSDVKPAYEPVFYFPVQQGVKQYSSQRKKMFTSYAPSFYFRNCERNTEYIPLPEDLDKNYIRLYKSGKPTCLFVLNNKWSQVTEEQKSRIKQLGYSNP